MGYGSDGSPNPDGWSPQHRPDRRGARPGGERFYGAGNPPEGGEAPAYYPRPRPASDPRTVRAAAPTPTAVDYAEPGEYPDYGGRRPPRQSPGRTAEYDQPRQDFDDRGRDERGYGRRGYDERGYGGDRGYGERGYGERGRGARGYDEFDEGRDRRGAPDDRDDRDENGRMGRRGRHGKRGRDDGDVLVGAEGVDGDPDHKPSWRARRRIKKANRPPHVIKRRKYIRRSLAGVFLILLGYVSFTMYPYVTGPGTDPLSARVAEWARDHGLGTVVTWLENETYKAPPTGGHLSAAQLAQLQKKGKPKPKVSASPTAPPDIPANIVPLAAGTVAGEGVWQAVDYDSSGNPTIETTAMRPDAEHTSDLAYVVWMRQNALTFTLHPGYQQPGGSWQTPDDIPDGTRTGLMATWNGGFKVTPDDALGGFYAEGREAVPLVDGKAAEVFYQDGSIKIGQWGRDETMTPDVIGVRQNLSLLVDGGVVQVDASSGSSAMWGYTINNAYFIARSGVGMMPNGDIVYVSGAELSVQTLAELLKQAGCVYGMELDINPDWVSFMTYDPAGNPAEPTPSKLWDFVQPADRYYQPSDRDFVAVYQRTTPSTPSPHTSTSATPHSTSTKSG
jgi:hypothetical protein